MNSERKIIEESIFQMQRSPSTSTMYYVFQDARIMTLDKSCSSQVRHSPTAVAKRAILMRRHPGQDISLHPMFKERQSSLHRSHDINWHVSNKDCSPRRVNPAKAVEFL